MDKIDKLLKIPQHEQRSLEWFKQRENKLTSSDAGTVLNLNPYQKPYEVLFKKCNYDPKPFIGNTATLHGQKYEDEAIEKYCKLTGNKNFDFGLLCYKDTHENGDYSWLAGSPDGISLTKDNRAILLEVKCPYKRIIKFGEVPKQYYPQIQLNMFICKLEIADFIEYKPPTTMNIVRVYIDYDWLYKNLKILDDFWKEVEYYREIGIDKHEKFIKKKKVLDLNDKEDVLSEYSFK